MSWKPEIYTEGKWHQNGLVFETEAEAKANAAALFDRWFAAENSRAVESDHAVNYRWRNGELIKLDTIDPLEMPGHRSR